MAETLAAAAPPRPSRLAGARATLRRYGRSRPFVLGAVLFGVVCLAAVSGPG